MTRINPEIRVVTHGGLLRRGDDASTDDTVIVDSGTTLAEVLTSLGIDRGIVGVAAVEGRIVQLDAVLHSDGVVHVYPIFGGG